MDTANTPRQQGLMLEEPLVFELGAEGQTGVDLPEPENPAEDHLGGLRRKTPIGLPGLSEPQVVRHYTRLSQKNYGIDTGFYPLGSCTMKYNPRLNEKLARLPGFADIHPFQPVSTVQGALAVMAALEQWLKALTGMDAVALSPAAGAHGELTGLMTIRAALEARGDARTTVLVPASAHGTNPATAALCGYRVQSVPAAADGRVRVDAVKEKLDAGTAAIMLTNPNTCGLFETDLQAIAEAVHEAGGFCYLDGANFNAVIGRVRVADLGVDAMHINLHKTFSTPHGGGGPGAGPVVFSKDLAPFMPIPFVRKKEDGFVLAEHLRGRAMKTPFGRIKGFHGPFGVWVRALAYMLSMGIDGLRQASGDAVLNANYLRVRLQEDLTLSFPGLCMHEVLFDDRFLKGTGVTTLDFAKALIDAGVHPMTIYFPLIVHGALLVEPTETESRATLDQFIDTVKGLAARAKAGDAAFFHDAPCHVPRRRLDETAAARHPRVCWRPMGTSN